MNESNLDFDNLSNSQTDQHKANQLVLKYFQQMWQDNTSRDDTVIINQSLYEDLMEELEECYEQEYKLIPPNDNIYVDLIPMNDLEKARIYTDHYPLLLLRKQILITQKMISHYTQKIIKHPFFEFITLIVIVFNSVMLALVDPLQSTQTDFQNTMDIVFLALYTTEAVLKMIAYGVVFVRGSYLRDAWNILDITVIITGFLPYIITNSSVKLSSLRSLRVLRPLRTISSVKALRSIMMALIASFGQLSNAILVLIFTFTVFSIAGLQMFMGYTKYRCFSEYNGLVELTGVMVDEAYCQNSSECPYGFICGKMSSSPQKNLISFDNFYITYMQVFVIQTTEGWTNIMQSVQLTFSEYSVIYFLLIIIIVTFFLINLTLAIINLNFSRAQNTNEPFTPEEACYNLKQIKKIGLYQSKKQSSKRFCRQQTMVKSKKFGTLLHNTAQKVAEMKSSAELPQDDKLKVKINFKPLLIKEFSKPQTIISNGQKIRLEGIYGVSGQLSKDAQLTTAPSHMKRNSIFKPRGIDDSSFEEIENMLRSGVQNRRQSLLKQDVSQIRKQSSNEIQQRRNSYMRQESSQSKQVNLQSPSKSPKRSPTNIIRQDTKNDYLFTFQRQTSNYSQVSPNKLMVPHKFQKAQSQKFHFNLTENLQKSFEVPQDTSVVLSEIDSQPEIPDDIAAAGLEEFEMSFQKPKPKQAKKLTQESEKKKQRQRRNKKYELPVIEDVSKDEEKLKIRLFQTQLITRVLFSKPYEPDSIWDVLADRQSQKLQLQQKLREESIKNMRKPILFTFASKFRVQTGTGSKTNLLIQTNKIQPLQESTTAPSQINLNHDSSKKKFQKNVPITLNYEKALEYMQQVIETTIDSSLNAAQIIHAPPKDKYFHNFLYYQEYHQTKYDDLSNPQDFIISECSYQDILKIPDSKFFDIHFHAAINSIARALNYDDTAYFIWLDGIEGVLLNIQRKLCYLVESWQFQQFMNLSVAANTVILALNGLVYSQSFDTLNEFFTILFTIEVGFKIIGYGPNRFIRDMMNLFDTTIVTISLLDLLLFSKGGKSQLGAVRAFRALRVLRITKLMRTLKFMNFIVQVLSNAFSSLLYVFLLLLLFLYIFTLLGMSFFGGVLTNSSRLTFDSFLESFITVFGVLTMSNWNNILYGLLQNGQSGWITVPYLISWIFIGNYVMLNLFLSSLLDSFDEEYSNLLEEMKDTSDIEQGMTQDNSKSNLIMKTFNSDQVKSATKKEFIYFQEPGMAQYSLYIFSQFNFLRKLCYYTVKNSYFEYLILFFIILVSIKLVIDTYIVDFQHWLDYFFAYVFGVEAVMKIISFGFILDNHSYLRDHWNKLDFIIVLCSFIDVYVDQIDLSFVKILRLLRALRPLRLISQNKSMRLLVNTLINSAAGIANVGVIIVLTMMMFGILGVNLASNKLNYCTYGDQYQYNKQTCPYGYWKTRDYNFDNILNAMLSLFILNTQEDWNNYMFYFVDSDENGPILNSSQYFIAFFIGYILIVSILMMNLFVGVILVNYKQAEYDAKDKSVSTEQENWMSTLKLIIDSNPNFAIYYAPKNRTRAIIFNIVSNKYYDIFVMLNIVGNIILLSSYYDDSPVIYTQTLEQINLAFSFVFISEAIMKLISFGLMGYFRNRANQFDFFVVLTSILDMFILFLGSSAGSLNSIPQITRIFRVLRVSRLFRLVRQFPELKKLIDTAIFSLPALMNVSLLMFLIFFIMSVLGVFLFSGIQTGQMISWLNNFLNFHSAFLLLFRSVTGENWYLFMYDTMYEGNTFAWIYWVLLQIIQAQVMLNLFVLIILNQYEMFYFSKDNPLQRFQEYETDFVDIWAPLASSSQGLFIHQKQLIDLMLYTRKPLGYDVNNKIEKRIKDWKLFNKDGDYSNQNLQKIKNLVVANSRKKASNRIMQMGLSTDESHNLEYHYVLFSFMKSFQIKQISENITIEGSLKIKEREEWALNKIRKKRVRNYNVNPLVQLLFVMMCFKAFGRFSTKIKSRRKIEGKEFSEKSDDSSYVQKSISYESKNSFSSSIESIHEQQQKFLPIPDTNVYQQFGLQFENDKSAISSKSYSSESQSKIGNLFLKVSESNGQESKDSVISDESFEG